MSRDTSSAPSTLAGLAAPSSNTGYTAAPTSRASAIVEVIRTALATADQSLSPADQDRVYGMLLAHIRARRPESVSPLGTLPAPTESIRDPRGPQ